jgi:hypothetical protein
MLFASAARLSLRTTRLPEHGALVACFLGGGLPLRISDYSNHIKLMFRISGAMPPLRLLLNVSVFN